MKRKKSTINRNRRRVKPDERHIFFLTKTQKKCPQPTEEGAYQVKRSIQNIKKTGT